MKNVCILTEDKRLSHELTLLLSAEGYAISAREDAALLFVDADTVMHFAAKAEERTITVSRDKKRSGGVFLLRPFTFEAFVGALKSAEVTDNAPLMSLTETKLLSVLKAAKGKSVSREQLIKEVWGEKGNDGLLNLYIHYLRQKLEKDGQRHIFSVRGKGYSYKC